MISSKRGAGRLESRAEPVSGGTEAAMKAGWFCRSQKMLRNVLLALLCSASILGILTVMPVFAESRNLGPGMGNATDFILRVLLVPFLVSLGLVTSCDTRQSVGWIPFAVGTMLSFGIGGSLIQSSSLWQVLPIWLLSAGSSVIGARLAARGASPIRMPSN